jgi:two-component system CheB/CheR fusion protein
MKGCDNVVEKKATDKKEIEKSKEEHLHTTEETPISKPPAPDADSNKSPKEDFPIVGIGASAGGLAAFENFFSAIPTAPILGWPLS